jgi:hypothetical protein
MASAAEAQAEEMVCTGPVTPSRRATASPGPLTSCDVRTPIAAARRSARKRAKKRSASSMPPVELPNQRPASSASNGGASPAWATASRAAARAKRSATLSRPPFAASTGGGGTCAARWVRWRLWSKTSKGPRRVSPERRPRQRASTPQP